MLPAINQWIFPGEMSTINAITKAKEIGFKAFEVGVGIGGPVKLDSSEADVTAIRKHAEEIGIKLTSVGCGLGWEFPLSSPDLAIRAKGVEVQTKALQIGHWLGVDTLLVVPGVVTPEVSYEVALDNAKAAIDELIPTAEKLGVCLALENVWNKFLLSPVETRDFIDQFGTPAVGAFFDIGNVVLYGYPEQWIRILGERVRMIHAKDFRASTGNMDGFVMLMEGNVNWPQVMTALREVGYNKALVAEYGAYAYSLDAALKHILTSLNTVIDMV